MNNILFKNKTILITGGTGSFGNAMTNQLLKLKIKEIRIFSRDEKKQDDMRRKLKDNRLKLSLSKLNDKANVSKGTTISLLILVNGLILELLYPSKTLFPIK